MKTRAQPLSAASLLVVTSIYAWSSERATLPAILALALAGAAAAGGRLSLGRVGQRLGTLGALGAGIGLAFTAEAIPPGPNALERPWSAAALAMLFAGTFRLYLREPEGGALVTAVAGTLALMAAGEVPSGPAYTAAVGLFLALSLLALRAGDRGRPPVSALPRRAVVTTMSVLGIASVLCGAALRSLPPLSDWTTLHLVFAGGDHATVGFSDRFWLGSLDGMLESDEVVMHIGGPLTDHLRGAVFDRYEGGRWVDGKRGGAQAIEPNARPGEGPARVEVTLSAGARDRYFLPLGARRVAPREDGAVVDRFGTVRIPDSTASSVVFELGEEPGLPIAPPSPEDTVVPETLRPTLDRLLGEWTSPEASPEQKIAAVAVHLEHDFTYSQKFRRHHREPLLDFLVEDRRGHCEYFASATALLSRAAGAPARVVAGYRVAEQNPVSGEWVVREKNAHAWAEIYLGGRWRTVDTTPPGSLEQNRPHRTHLLGALADAVRALWDRAATGDAAARARQALAAVAVVVLILVLGRRSLRLRREGRAGGSSSTWEAPPEDLTRLFAALDRQGIARSPAEPLERFAGRLEEAGRGETASLLRRWAALRYGGVGDRGALLGEIAGHAAALQSVSLKGSP